MDLPILMDFEVVLDRWMQAALCRKSLLVVLLSASGETVSGLCVLYGRMNTEGEPTGRWYSQEYVEGRRCLRTTRKMGKERNILILLATAKDDAHKRTSTALEKQ